MRSHWIRALGITMVLAHAFTTARSLAAAQPSTLQAVLTRTLDAQRTATGTTGAAASISHCGHLVWSAASGKSVLQEDLPFERRTLSSVASVTKVATAAIVMRLVESGLLALDEPIAGHVPAYVPGTRDVTIRDLLGMRSGYEDVENSAVFLSHVADPNYHWTDEDFYRPLKAPHFKPGSQVEYSNVNYVLLGTIIDTVYPGGVAAAFQQLVRYPAHLRDDVVFRREPRVAYRFAHGYQTQNGQTTDIGASATNLGISTAVWGTIWTDGGIGATADGLTRFGDALFSGKIVKPSTLAVMEAPLATSSQGLGLEQAMIDGHSWYGHLGSFDGYLAILLHDPIRDVTIAGVANSMNLDDGGAQRSLFVSLITAFDAGQSNCP